jgi:hypothetical protein
MEAEVMDDELDKQASTVRRAQAVRCVRQCCKGFGYCLLALAILAGGLKELWWDRLPQVHPARLWPRQIAASSFYNALLQPWATSRKSQQYFAEQLPLMEQSANNFECADYWCKNLTVHSIHTDWYTRPLALTHRTGHAL